MYNVQLSKSSSESDLKRYFTEVLELSKSDNKFPINLDEVWPLVYSAKEKAVRALKREFFENEDFITLAKKGEGGQFDKIDYFLSLSCLEYFIARKVRPVFEVYRQVFHKVAETPMLPSYQIDDPIQRAERWIEEQKERKMLEDANLKLIEQTEIMLPKVRSYEEIINTPQTEWLKTTQEVANEIGMSAQRLNAQLVALQIIYKSQSGEYLVTSKYADWGLHSIVSYPVSDKRVKTYLKWTDRGRLYIRALHTCHWDKRRAWHLIKDGKEDAS